MTKTINEVVKLIGLEYILSLYNVQHQDLAEKLGIRKQNINLWVKGKQKISKKYLPILAEYFGLPQELFQKELSDIDRLVIQKEKLQKEVKPFILKYEIQLSFECENEPDLVEVPIYNSKEMNEVEFEIEKTKVAQGFREVLVPISTDYELSAFRQLLLLFQKYGDVPVLRYMIDAMSHYFNVLPEWVQEPESEEFEKDFIQLVKYHLDNESKFDDDSSRED